MMEPLLGIASVDLIQMADMPKLHKIFPCYFDVLVINFTFENVIDHDMLSALPV